MTQAAMQARLPAAPVSPAYSLMSQDHVKLKYLFDLIKPAVVMVQDGPTFEKALKALDLTGVTVVHVARPCDGIKSVSFADLAATPVTKEVEESIATDHAGHRRQAAVHLGLDRHAQGRHQHPGDDVRQCGDDDAGAAARSERADRDRARLDAVESHHGRQCRVQSGAGRWRHALYRRRPADAGPDRGDHAQSARGVADLLRQRAGRLCRAGGGDGEGRRAVPQLLQESERDGLWRRAAAGRSL